MDIESIKVDSAKSERGDWVGDIPGMEGLRLKVRGLGSAAYRNALAAKVRAVPRGQRRKDGSLPIEINDRLVGETMLDVILIDWDGMTKAGAPIAYDKELARKLLIEPDYAAFRDAVFFAAQIVGEEDRAFEDTLLGNSGKPSSGSSDGQSTQTQ